MEKVNFKNDLDKTLIGNYFDASTDRTIVMAHGFTGDKSSGGKFDRIAESLHGDSYNVLAFDFSGYGESEDEDISLAKAIEDLRSAIKFVESRGGEKIGLFGHSFGSLVCLTANPKNIITMVLTGAHTDSMKYDWPKFFTLAQLEELKNTGKVSDPTKFGPRKSVVYSQKVFQDFESVDQNNLLAQIKCPVLLIHGNHPDDVEERQLLAKSQKGISLLPPESKLVVIEGGKHGFGDHVDRVINETRNWFNQYLL